MNHHESKPQREQQVTSFGRYVCTDPRGGLRWPAPVAPCCKSGSKTKNQTIRKDPCDSKGYTHTHTLVPSRLPSHVFILLFLLRAHLHLCPSLNFASPRGGVCVCNLWNHRDPFGLFCFGFASNFTAGGPSTLGWHGPTKTHPSCRENVPAWCTWALCKAQLMATFLPFLFVKC